MERRNFIRGGLAAAIAAGSAFAAAKFSAELGINLYSVRDLASADLPGTLQTLQDLGFRSLEVGDFYGRSPQEFGTLLKRHGFTMLSLGASYKDLDTQLGMVAADAKTLGARYVVCSTIPHTQKHLTMDDARRAAEKLNAWGEALAKERLQLCYHTHGTEFDPAPGGTVFDSLLKGTHSQHVRYEMDIFWIVYGLQDPVDFLRRYPGRFPLMHVKDMRSGMVLNQTPAQVAEDDSVSLGSGVVKVAAALEAGEKYGVEHFFLEEEATVPLPQIRESLRYIASLR